MPKNKKGPGSKSRQKRQRSATNSKEQFSQEPDEPHPAGRSPFELLPPEIHEIIIKMFLRNSFSETDLSNIVGLRKDDPEDPNSTVRAITNEHNFLVDVIANISTRFRNLASFKSLWKGEVYIKGDKNKIRGVMERFLSNGITSLHLINSEQNLLTPAPGNLTTRPRRMKTPIQKSIFSAADILNLAERCPDLEKLNIFSTKMDAWPIMTTPWTSMKILKLANVDIEVDLFKDINIHHSLPNLAYFGFGVVTGLDSITLPEMGQCKFLEVVGLHSGNFQLKSLPRGIKRLEGYGFIVNYSREALEKQYGCEVRGISFEMDMDDDDEFSEPGDYEDDDDEEGSDIADDEIAGLKQDELIEIGNDVKFP